ncbi:MAG: ribonuclease HII [Gammaproteobacteria bacterium]
MRIVGVDEAGRGPLAGPVVAAAVMLDPARKISGLKDSKILSAARREQLYDVIVRDAACYGIAFATVEEIDRLNIYHATLLAMQRAVAALRVEPIRVLVDGNVCPQIPYDAEAVVKGDAKIPAISAASILAKVTRDRMMDTLDLQYPCYGFSRHRGYSTAAHVQALLNYGPSPEHRRSFRPVAAAYGMTIVARGAKP